MRKNHKWTREEENKIYTNRILSPIQMKSILFKDDKSITIQSIADKKSRIVDMREQPNYEKPWSSKDRAYMLENYKKSNNELKRVLGRGSKELDQVRFNIINDISFNGTKKNNINFAKPEKNIVKKSVKINNNMLLNLKPINAKINVYTDTEGHTYLRIS